MTLKITVIKEDVASRKRCWEVESAQTKALVGRGLWELSVAVTGEAFGAWWEWRTPLWLQGAEGEEAKAGVRSPRRKDPCAAEGRHEG